MPLVGMKSGSKGGILNLSWLKIFALEKLKIILYTNISTLYHFFFDHNSPE